MTTKLGIHSTWTDSNLPVIPVAAEEQSRRVEQAIAKRAYQIFERRGGLAWHELEDWRRAETELRCTHCFSRTTEDHTIVIGTDAECFAPNSIEIWAAPRQITISGHAQPRHSHAEEKGPYPADHRVFQSIDLPCPVDCARAHAHVRNHCLEIKLPRLAVEAKLEHAGAT
ncbi:MAG: DUF2934 domain-containing protein [Candidatus Acidiferrum sp.]